MTEDNKINVHKIIEESSEALVTIRDKLQRTYYAEDARTGASKVDNPLEEFGKLCKLIHSQTTKLGIVFKPPIADDTLPAALQAFKDVLHSVRLIVSLAYQMRAESETYSLVFSYVLKSKVVDIVGHFRELSLGLLAVLDSKDEGAARLVAVGKVWDDCNALQQILKGGIRGALVTRLHETAGMVGDAISELEEWISNPSNDLFEWGDEFSDNEDGEKDDNEEETQVPQDVIDCGKKILPKCKLVKLLVSTLEKSIPPAATTTEYSATIDTLCDSQVSIGENIDFITCAVMVESSPDAVDEYKEALDNNVEIILRIVRELNADDSKKLEWTDAWKAKYYASEC